MKPPVNVPQPIASDVRVDLSRADVGMPEQFLDDAQVSAVFEKVGGEAVPQHVRRDIARDAGTRGAFLDAQPQCNRAEGCAALIQEKIRR